MNNRDNSILLPAYHIGYTLLEDGARKPTKALDGDAGWDLYANEEVMIRTGERKVIKTGISLEIPDEYVGLIWPRSGLAAKSGIDVLAGVIDSSYRGEILVCLYNTNVKLPLFSEQDYDVHIKQGDRIAQILFQKVPHFKLIEMSELSDTDRGSKAFGSTGK